MALAIVLVVISGVTIVLARITNARLAITAGQHYSSLMNYITGFVGAIILFLIMGMPVNTPIDASKLSFMAYLGGAVGLASVYLCNMMTPKVSAIQFTLLLFLGQLFSGLLIDYFLDGTFSAGKTIGGILVMVGMVINVLADRQGVSKAESEEKNKGIDQA